MTTPADRRLVGRATFGRVAHCYTAARPSYPEEMIGDLVRACGIGPGVEVLEIGPGTGQLTMPLAETGCRILAVELSEELATVARNRLSDFPKVEVIVADFDSWPIPAGACDVVVAATSFHWLDPETRIERCRVALKPGGKLAVVGTAWGVLVDTEDPFFVRSQECYSRWDPEHDPAVWQPRANEVTTFERDLIDSGRFSHVNHFRYLVRRSYTRSEFVQLATTYSTLQSWPADRREGFLECVARMIDREFGGVAVRNDLYDLSVAAA